MRKNKRKQIKANRKKIKEEKKEEYNAYSTHLCLSDLLSCLS